MADEQSINRVVLAAALARRILDEAKTALPGEVCGLLIGIVRGGICTIERIERSDNLAADKRREFEIDPKLQFRLLRELRGSGRDVVGVYHSHPDGEAIPSQTDAARALDTGFVWVIVGRGELRAYAALGEGKGFRPVEVCV